MNFKINPLLLGITSTVFCSHNVMAAEQQKPNIVFLFVDDLGYADVGFNGSKYYETPNMDALAKQSLVFENSYAYPTSSPSRAALLTGNQGPGLDYDAFSPDLAERIRGQEARLVQALKGFGELQDVTYVGQEQGAELFALDFANARTQWIIAFNGEDQIAVLLFRPAQAQ